MWIVRVALNRPYTFIVLALLILIAAPVIIFRTPTDMFPGIDIPVVSIGWTYTGLNPEEMEGRLTSPYEKALTTLVDNIQHIESTTYNGQSVVKVYLQPGASLDTANAQITAASQFMLRQLPPGTLPPQIINFSASSVPILQLGISGDGLSEAQLNDYATNFIRTQLVTVPGAVVPSPYGGKQRQITINMDQAAMQSKGIAPGDVLNALAQQSVVMPSGTIKVGQSEYDVRTNGAPRTIQELADIPIKQVNGTTIYLRDVASVSDGFQFQTNIVRQDGRRGVLISILKSGNSSTLDVVRGVRALLPRIASTVPPELKMTPLADQSVFVRSAVQGVIREAIIAAGLTAVMILVFLGSWRSTLIIAISIPLSILTSVIILGLIGETINTMTLGGLALAVGILVDDATVTIENIERFMEDGYELREAILQGAAQISVPALVSTLCICIVFLPMFFLGGVARYLFVPLAEAVVFAMLASYMLSRTLVPTLAMYLLRAKRARRSRARDLCAVSERVRARLRTHKESLPCSSCRGWCCVARSSFLRFLASVFLSSFLFRSSVKTSFPVPTAVNSFCMCAAHRECVSKKPRGCSTLLRTRFERNSRPQIDNILDNIGLPYSALNTQHLTNGSLGAYDGDILVSSRRITIPQRNWLRALRTDLPAMFPAATFYTLPADITTQILNFGQPAPIDIQIEGNDVWASKAQADKILAQLRQVPGLVDLRIQQPFDYPTLPGRRGSHQGSPGRLYGARCGQQCAQYAQRQLSGNADVLPELEKHGELQHRGADSAIQDGHHAGSREHSHQSQQQCGGLRACGFESGDSERSCQQSAAGTELGAVNHYNIRRVVDVYANVQGPRSRRYQQPDHDDSQCRCQIAAARHLRHAQRARWKRCTAPTSGCWAGWCFPSCLSTC